MPPPVSRCAGRTNGSASSRRGRLLPSRGAGRPRVRAGRRRLALVPEPDNEHDPNAVAIWNEDRTVQAGYVPGRSRPSCEATSRPSRSGASRAACACSSLRQTLGSERRTHEAHDQPGVPRDLRGDGVLAVRGAVRLLRRRPGSVVNPERFYAAVDEDGTLVGFYYSRRKATRSRSASGFVPTRQAAGWAPISCARGSTSTGSSRRWKDHSQRRRLQRARHQGLRARGVPRDRPACAPFCPLG